LPHTAANDSDHPARLGDVGMPASLIDSIYDMRTLFAGIPARPDARVDDMNGAVLPILALFRRGSRGKRAFATAKQTIRTRSERYSEMSSQTWCADTTSNPPALRCGSLRTFALYLRKKKCRNTIPSPISAIHMQSIPLPPYPTSFPPPLLPPGKGPGPGGRGFETRPYTGQADGVEYIPPPGSAAGLDIDRFAAAIVFMGRSA